MNLSSICLTCMLVSGIEVQACPGGNFECLERNHETACSDRNATIESCQNWIGILEQQSKKLRSKEVLLKIGQAYQALALLTEDPRASRAHKDRAIQIYRTLIKRDGSDAQAIFALAAATDDRAERIQLLRRGIALEPDMFAIQLLSNELVGSGEKKETLKAARLTEQAFAQQTGRNKWHLASKAYSLYLDAGATSEAADLQRRVIEQLRVEEITEIAPDANPNSISHVLASLCDHYAVPVIGGRRCINSIGVVVDHVVSNESVGGREELANRAADAMVEVGEAELELEKENPDWAKTFKLWLEKLMGHGFDTFSVYYAYARVAEGDARLRALQKATALSPQSGQAAYRLGLEYLDRRMWQEAIQELTRARQLLPSPQKESVDDQLEFAESQLLAKYPKTGP